MSFLESAAQRLLETLDESVETGVGRRPRHRKIRRAGYAAGGLALLTAASAGISSLRDRLEDSSDS